MSSSDSEQTNPESGRSYLSDRAVECPEALLRHAGKSPRLRIAVVNATSPTVLESVRQAVELGLVEPVLIGPEAEIRSACEQIDWDIGEFEIAPADTPEEAAAVATSMAASQKVDSLLKGDIATDTLLSAVMNRASGLRSERSLSHVFQMTIPDNEHALFITDAVLNIQPCAERKADIARNAISLLHAMEYEQPKIALLSASEKTLSAMPSTQHASDLASRAAKGEFAGALVDGPLALDLAISIHAAKIKDVQSEVAGNADVLLVPNIETGNALFKMMVHLMSATAAGIVLGAKVPIALTSRSDPVAARVASLALTKIYVNSAHKSDAD